MPNVRLEILPWWPWVFDQFSQVVIRPFYIAIAFLFPSERPVPEDIGTPINQFLFLIEGPQDGQFGEVVLDGLGCQKSFDPVPLRIFNKFINCEFLGFALAVVAGNLAHHLDVFIGVLTGISADRFIAIDFDPSAIDVSHHSQFAVWLGFNLW